MTREEAVIDFLKGLRISLSNAAAYSIDHPYFAKSIEAFKEKVDALFAVVDPVRIVSSPNSLFVDGRLWEEKQLYLDLAQAFHLRKIKSVEIHGGVTAAELAGLVAVVGMPRRDVVRQGGVPVLFPRQRHPHIVIEEVDYTPFLAGGDIEADVWMYMMTQGMQAGGGSKFEDCIRAFPALMRRLSAKDVTDDAAIRENVGKFIGYLRSYKRDEARACAQTLFSSLTRYKDSFGGNIEKVREFFKEFAESDYGNLLWDEIVKDESFNAGGLDLFVRIVGGKDHQNIAAQMERESRKDIRTVQPSVLRRAREIADMPRLDSVSAVYQHTLSIILKNAVSEETIEYSREELRRNYRYILLMLLDTEKDASILHVVVERIRKEWEKTAGEGDYQYLKLVLDTTGTRGRENTICAAAAQDFSIRAAELIESRMWDDLVPPGMDALLPGIQSSARGAGFYLDMFFDKKKLSVLALTLFFRFFPAETDIFYRKLEDARHNMEFLIAIVRALKDVQSPLVVEAFKRIFAFANDMVRLEILACMRSASDVDEAFLLSLINGANMHIKRAALAALMRKKPALDTALRSLLAVRSFWGARNKALMENLRIVGELDIRDARPYVNALGARRFFWNRALRRTAQSLLGTWNG